MNPEMFDYVKYDEKSQYLSDSLKSQVLCISAMINALPQSREKSLAMTKLEESFMWMGKAIRNEQVSKNQIASNGGR